MHLWQMLAWGSWVVVSLALGGQWAAGVWLVSVGVSGTGWCQGQGGGGRGDVWWCVGQKGFPREQFGSSVVCLDLDRLLTGCEAVIRLVPEGCVVCCAKFGVDGDVLGGIDFHPACGGVSSEFTVIGGWVP